MTPPEATTLLQAELITRQRHEIAELKASNRQLEADNLELKKVLAITLRDSLGSSPIVISRSRLEEAAPEFALDENMSGDILISLRRKN